MALAPCPECQKTISERAVFCPSCGFSLSMPYVHSMTRQNESSPENSIPKHFLRSTPMEISPQQLISSNQFEISSKGRWFGGIKINNDFFSPAKGIVCDRATGLIWQHSGSKQLLTWDEACTYIIWLNNSRFCNFVDWRLPTIEELDSLSGSGEDELYSCGPNFEDVSSTRRPFSLDFDQKQVVCWSCDLAAAGEWFCPNRAPDRLSDYVRVDIPPNRFWAFSFDTDNILIRTGILGTLERCKKLWVRAVRNKLTHFG